MSINRVRVSMRLLVKSRFSLGSGKVAAGQQREGEAHTQLFATDADHRPWIPASSLKGALKARYRHDKKEEVERLFGTVSANDTGRIGDIAFGNGWAVRESPTDRPGTRKIMRNAIDRKRGSTEHNKLFEQSFVDPGTRFGVEFSIKADDDVASAAGRLGTALAPLFAGIQLGGGRRHGNGELTADAAFAVECFGLKDGKPGHFPDDAVLKAFRSAFTSAAGVHAEPEFLTRLTLSAEEDYSRLDSVTYGDGKMISSLERDENGAPLLTPSTLLGALRARAAWLAGLTWLRDHTSAPPDRARETDSPDQRFRSLEDFTNDNTKKRDLSALLPLLSPVERLFGVSGWAGLIEVAELTPSVAANAHNRVNVAIDRFTGGSLHGALYTTEVAHRPHWTVALQVSPSPARANNWTGDMKTADLALLKRLVADIVQKGLQLGHGGSKGWGWMSVEKVNP